MKRRVLLASLGVGVTALSGCVSDADLEYARDFVYANAGEVTCDGETSSPLDESEIEAVDGTWVQSGYDSRNTGYAADEQGPDGCPQVQWHASPTPPLDGMNNIRQPLVADGRVYSNSHSKLFAFSATTGELEWEVDHGSLVRSSAYDDGTLYVAGYELAAFDAESGEEQWRTGVPNQRIRDSITFAEGQLYLPLRDRRLLSMTTDGDQRWSAYIEEAERSPTDTSLGNVTKPAVADGVVYAGCVDDGVSAFDAATGEDRWHRPEMDVGAGPVVDDQYVYVRGRDLRALDRADGSTVWTALEDEGRAHRPVLADGTLYVLVGHEVSDPGLVAIDAESGAERWRRELDRYRQSPVAADGLVYVPDDERLRAFDADDGSEVWRLQTSTNTLELATIAGGVVFLMTDKRVYALA